MHLEIPHKFTKTEATSRIKNALADAKQKVADKVKIHEERWEGDTLHFDFTAQGQRISGTLATEDNRYVLDAKLPLMLRMFEGRIEREASEYVKKMF